MAAALPAIAAIDRNRRRVRSRRMARTPASLARMRTGSLAPDSFMGGPPGCGPGSGCSDRVFGGEGQGCDVPGRGRIVVGFEEPPVGGVPRTDDRLPRRDARGRRRGAAHEDRLAIVEPDEELLGLAEWGHVDEVADDLVGALRVAAGDDVDELGAHGGLPAAAGGAD